MVLKLAERYEEALESADQATILEPDYARGWLNRGIALAALGRYDEAVSSYDTALILDPGLTEAEEGKNEAISLM